MSNFKIGEKVVCINPIGELIKNEIYIVSNTYNGNSGTGIHVKELAPKKNDLGGFYWFSINRFRKLDYEFAENLLKEISESVNQKHLQN